MPIAVTGGTGYVGAHIARALLAAGHDLRLMVTAAEAEAPVLPHLRALGRLTVMIGDVRDTSSVTELLDGADALLHAAGVVGTDDRRAQLMWDVNAHATEAILTRAVQLGLDPVVSVSSYSALYPPPSGVITRDTPTSFGRSAYAKTKGYADRVARRLQDEGAPVVVTYPSSVVGSAFHTACGVTERGFAPIVRWGIAPRLRGGMQMIDVRDVAEVHSRLMTPGQAPRRYICGGVMLTFDEMIDAVEAGMDRRVRRIPVSPHMMRGIGRMADFAGRFVSLGDGFSYEAAMLLTSATPTDDRATTEELGITWRCPKDAVTESVRRGHRDDARL